MTNWSQNSSYGQSFQNASYDNSGYGRSSGAGSNGYGGSSYGQSSYGRGGGQSYGGQSYGGNSYGDNSYGGNSYGKGNDRMGGLGANLEKIDWNRELEKLPKFEKNFYIEHPNVKDMSPSEVNALRKKMDLQVCFRFRFRGQTKNIFSPYP